MKGLRYLCYLGFALAALVFWPLYFMLVLGIFPFPAEPACSLDPNECPPPGVAEQMLNIVSIFGAIPTTALVFVFYRRLVRRLFGLDSD